MQENVVRQPNPNQGREQKSVKVANQPLWHTNLGDRLKPTGVVFTLSTESIEQWLVDYIRGNNIQGVEGAAIAIARDGRQGADIIADLVVRKNSPAISRSSLKINPRFEKKLDRGVIRLARELEDLVVSLSGVERDQIVCAEYNQMVFVQLSIFHVLALMLDVDPNIHTIQILDVVRSTRDPKATSGDIRVVKTYKSVSKQGKKMDFGRIAVEKARYR